MVIASSPRISSMQMRHGTGGSAGLEVEAVGIGSSSFPVLGGASPNHSARNHNKDDSVMASSAGVSRADWICDKGNAPGMDCAFESSTSAMVLRDEGNCSRVSKKEFLDDAGQSHSIPFIRQKDKRRLHRYDSRQLTGWFG